MITVASGSAPSFDESFTVESLSNETSGVFGGGSGKVGLAHESEISAPNAHSNALGWRDVLSMATNDYVFTLFR